MRPTVAAVTGLVFVAAGQGAASADGVLDPGAGVTCSSPRCEVRAVTPRKAEVSRKSASTGTIPTGNRRGGAAPHEPPTVTQKGWLVDLKHGVSLIPDFWGEPAKDTPQQPDTPTPEQLAQQAVEQLVLPKPVIRMSPHADAAQVVGVPTWLWIDAALWRPVSKTANVPGMAVTATATPKRVVWSTGDGATVECAGPGTPYSRTFAPEADSPDCGHVFRRSSAGRADEAFTVTATMTWDVVWHGGGQGGRFPGLRTAAQIPVKVTEVQALVRTGRRGR